MASKQKTSAFKIIASTEHTAYDFEVLLRDKVQEKNISILALKDEDELTLLHAVAFHEKATFLHVLHRLGYWEQLRGLQVSATSNNRQCAGKDVKQIAETMAKSRKLVKVIEEIDQWEKSLTPLHQAARKQDLAKVQSLVEKRPSLLAEKDNLGCNALYWACVQGNLPVVQVLYDAGVNPSHINDKGESLLHIACIMGQNKLISLLVSVYKIAVDLKDKAKRTAMSYTAENGDLVSLKQLLQNGVELDPEMITLAAYHGGMRYFEHLLDNDMVPVAFKDENKKTAFMRAAEGGKLQIITYLLEKGDYMSKMDWCDTDSHQRNILHFAVEGRKVEVVTALLKKAKEVEVLKHLINGQDIYVGGELCFLIRGKDKGRQAWHYVEVKRNMVHVFMKQTKCGSVDVALYDVVVRSGWGSDPEPEVMEELEAMFKKRIRDSSNTAGDASPLHIACFKEHVDICEVLLKNGADPNLKDSFGLTPLHVACMRGNIKLIELLEAHDADATVQGNSGKTPMQVAEDNGHTNIVKFMKGVYSVTQVEEAAGVFRQRMSAALRRLPQGRSNARLRLIECVRGQSVDNNQFLLDMGSGPVMEETGRPGE